jgi:hypothetical protein
MANSPLAITVSEPALVFRVETAAFDTGRFEPSLSLMPTAFDFALWRTAFLEDTLAALLLWDCFFMGCAWVEVNSRVIFREYHSPVS